MSAYNKEIRYHFSDGSCWAITDIFVEDDGSARIELEETRKNGQEDCHEYATLLRDTEGVWTMPTEDYLNSEDTVRWNSKHLVGYLTEHGLPDEKGEKDLADTE